MGKRWEREQYRRFNKEVKLGKPYYVIIDLVPLGNAPCDDKRYKEYVFTEYSRLTGTARTSTGVTATEICAKWGPVYEDKPVGMYSTDHKFPDLPGPLGADYSARLDEAEIRGLEKLVRDLDA